MMKNNFKKLKSKLLFFGLLFVIFTACEKDTINPDSPLENASTEQVLTDRSDINNLIIEAINDGKELDWRELSDDQLWAAYQFADNITYIGWNEESSDNHEREVILDFVRESEGISDDKDLILEDFKAINTLVLKINKKETLLGLKRMSAVADLFEIGYEMFTQEQLESLLTESQSKETSKQQSTAKEDAFSRVKLHGRPTDYPSRFNYHHIPNAWKKGLHGKNIGVAILDDGILRGDVAFGVGGNYNGLNPPHLKRSYNKGGFFKWCLPCFWIHDDGFYTNKTHGTEMTRIVAGPMSLLNSQNPTTVGYMGVAYAANANTFRTSHSVFIDPVFSVRAVTKAYLHLANRPDIRIISMSMGTPLKSFLLARAIKKCTNRGKLVFNAAGTFYKEILKILPQFVKKTTLFPARMQETIAVTGVKDNGATWCDGCHGKADFVIEFKGTDGSSSNSTATTAGIAALIWGKEPHLTAQQVLQRMRNASEFGNNRQGWKGHGRIFLNKYLNAINHNNNIKAKAKPFYRYWNGKAKNHFYTAYWSELGGGSAGYRYEGVAFKVFINKEKGTVPLYRYFNGRRKDHLYTTNWDELGNGKGGYRYEGVACYIFNTHVIGTIPIHRYYNWWDRNHFYTIDWNHLGRGRGAYWYEGVAGYVFP